MKEQALALARAGFAVFPLRPGTKVPLLPKEKGGKGHQDATRDEFQVEAWWDDHPNAGIGLCPGRCEPPLVVVDVDVKRGVPGPENSEKLRAEGLLPATVRVDTPSGGWHLFYRVPEGAPQLGSSPLDMGVDVKGHTGYVVCYRPEKLLPGVQTFAPANLIKRMGEAKTRHEIAQEWLVEPDRDFNVRAFEQWLRREIEAGRGPVPGAGANILTYATAAMARDYGLSPETTAVMLWEIWNPAGGFTEFPRHWDKLSALVDNAYRYAKNPAGCQVLHDTLRADLRAHADKIGVSREIRAPYRFLAPADLKAQTPPGYLIKGLLYAQQLGLIIGPWGAYKSFIVLDQAIHLALGLPWAGRRVRGGDVLFIAAESAAGIRARLIAWELKHERTIGPSFRVLADAPKFLDGGIEQLRQSLDAYAEHGYRPDVIYVDTLAAVAAGLNENAGEDMGQVIAAAHALARDYDLAVVLVHHTGHKDEHRARGWSGLEAGVDMVALIQPVKDQKIALYTLRKLKDVDDQIAGLSFQGEVVTVGKDVDGDPITSLVFTPGDVSKLASGEDTKIAMRLNALRAVLTEDPIPHGTGPGKSMGPGSLAERMAMVLVPDHENDPKGMRKQEMAVSEWLKKAVQRTGKHHRRDELLTYYHEGGYWALPSE